MSQEDILRFGKVELAHSRNKYKEVQLELSLKVTRLEEMRSKL